MGVQTPRSGVIHLVDRRMHWCRTSKCGIRLEGCDDKVVNSKANCKNCLRVRGAKK